MKLNVSQFPLIRSRRVCVCCYPCRVKWLNTRSVVGDVIRRHKLLFLFRFCQKSDVFLVSFSWWNCGYGRYSSGTTLDLFTERQRTAPCALLLHGEPPGSSRILQPSCRLEITSLLLISISTFCFYLHRFWHTGVRLVFVFPLCVTHIPGCENVEKGLSNVWMTGWGLSGFSGTFFLVAVL